MNSIFQDYKGCYNFMKMLDYWMTKYTQESKIEVLEHKGVILFLSESMQYSKV